MTESESMFAPLERWSPVLFLVAGLMMVVFATNTALRTYVGTSYPIVQEIVAPAGFLIGVVGLLGLYPGLVDRTPRLARVALAVAVVAAANWGVIVIKNVGTNLGVLPELGALTMATGVIAFVTMLLSYGLFGIGGSRADVYQQAVRGLLVFESINFLVLIVTVFASLAIPFVAFEIGHLVVHLGIGFTLWTKGVPSDYAEMTADSTV